MKPIPFNLPYASPLELAKVATAIQNRRLCGDGPFTKQAQALLEARYGYPKVLLTSSCTDALELSALLAGIGVGDEVIVPAFTFVSSANAFVLRGAKIVFADSEARTPNIDAAEVARLVTPRTRALVVVHYAGICCDMEPILKIAAVAGIPVIEDSAQALNSTYRDRPAGSFGRFAAFSFHETKNVSCGEGGMIVLQGESDFDRAEVIREKGTNRSAFMRGEVDRYDWADIGSSFLPSELNAAFLCAQLEQIDTIQRRRLEIFALYDRLLREPLARLGIATPCIPPDCVGNAHAYFIVLPSAEARAKLVDAMKAEGVVTASHYASLHKSRFFLGRHDGRTLPNSDRYSEGLLRLPLYYELEDSEVCFVCEMLMEKLKQCGPSATLRMGQRLGPPAPLRRAPADTDALHATTETSERLGSSTHS